MDFIITKEQKRLQKACREFFKKECPSDFVREMERDSKGFTDDFWRKMGELDCMALIIPEAYDGLEGDLMDLVLMLEEMGRACAPGPFFSTIVTGAIPIIHFGSEEQKRELLPKIANGKIILTLALAEPETTKWDPYYIRLSAQQESEDFTISGKKLFVPDAHAADYFICVTRTDGQPGDLKGITMLIVDVKSAGIEMLPLKTIGGDKQFEVTFNNVRVPKTAVIGEAGEGGTQLRKILHYAEICKCAEMVGGADKVLEMASTYAKERKQFGRAIGSFQAVQHHCANMLIDLEGSRYITYKAAWALMNSVPAANRQVAVAKSWVSEAFQRVVALGHQVQGGYAFMEEHDMPLYSRRAAAAAVQFGDGAYHRDIVADEIGL